MENKKKKRIVIALGGNALGNTLPEQMKAVKITAKAIVALIEEGCEVIYLPRTPEISSTQIKNDLNMKKENDNR